MKFKSINPYTEEVNWTYDSFPIGECKSQIEKSRYAFLSWSSLSDEDTDIGLLEKRNLSTVLKSF
jgi:succinate-semialdehyde dehydrogenase / glutarate-semialdehyde dehydrogenase